MWSILALTSHLQPCEWFVNEQPLARQPRRWTRSLALTRQCQPRELARLTRMMSDLRFPPTRGFHWKVPQAASGAKRSSAATSLRCAASSVPRRLPRLRVAASSSEDLVLDASEAQVLLYWCQTDARLALRTALSATLPRLRPDSTLTDRAPVEGQTMQRQPEQQTALAQSHTSKASTTFPLESIAPFDAVFAQEPTPAQIELSIYLCTDDQIRLLNKHYRSTDESTDVLSFPQQQLRLLGDVVISIETAKRQATGHLRDELRILLLHGILHLLGFDHEIDEARYETFRQLEQKMMRILGWRGNGLILDHQVQLGNECSEE